VGCNDSYEIWPAVLKIIHPDDPYTGVNEVRAAFVGAVAAFDPITTRDPANPTRLLYTQDYRAPGVAAISPSATYRGCERESYDGPLYWRNYGPTEYWTDAYGKINTAGQSAAHPIRQQISTYQGEREAFKYRQNFCSPGVFGAVN
jgi:hypothetical protein